MFRQSLSSSLCDVESCQYDGPVGLPGVWQSDKKGPQRCSHYASREPLACGSSSIHTVSWAWNPVVKVVGKLPKKLRIYLGEAQSYTPHPQPGLSSISCRRGPPEDKTLYVPFSETKE